MNIMQKKIIFSILILSAVLVFTSCLKQGLDDNLPKFGDALITDVFMEYRFEDPTASSGGSPVVRIQNLTVDGKQFKKKESTPGAALDSVIFNVKVPGASGSFTAAEKAKVTQKNIVFMCNISTASIMEPLEGAPRAGVPGDFSTTRLYKVTAANGSSRTWAVRINSFTN
jgi:hypothetical protein